MFKKLLVLFVALIAMNSTIYAGDNPDGFSKGESTIAVSTMLRFSDDITMYGFIFQGGKYFSPHFYWLTGLAYYNYSTSTPFNKPYTVVTPSGNTYYHTYKAHMYTDSNYLTIPTQLGFVLGKPRGMALRLEGGLIISYLINSKIGESNSDMTKVDVSTSDRFGFVPTVKAALGLWGFHLYVQYNFSEKGLFYYGFSIQF